MQGIDEQEDQMDITAIEKAFAKDTRVRVTDKSLRLRRSPGVVTSLSVGRGAPYAMVQLDRADCPEPMAFDIDQLLVEG